MRKITYFTIAALIGLATVMLGLNSPVTFVATLGTYVCAASTNVQFMPCTLVKVHNTGTVTVKTGTHAKQLTLAGVIPPDGDHKAAQLKAKELAEYLKNKRLAYQYYGSKGAILTADGDDVNHWVLRTGAAFSNPESPVSFEYEKAALVAKHAEIGIHRYTKVRKESDKWVY